MTCHGSIAAPSTRVYRCGLEAGHEGFCEWRDDDVTIRWSPANAAPLEGRAQSPLSTLELIQVGRLVDEWPADLAERVLARLSPPGRLQETR